LDEPEKWTPLNLAEQFGISISRIEAILRLKALQDKFKANGTPLQTELSKEMDQLLGATTLRYDEKRKLSRLEPIRETLVNGMHPFVQLLEEEERFTPKDAAKLLKLEPFENITKRLDKKAAEVFEVEPNGSMPDSIEANPVLGGKFDFMFVDTSAPKDFVLIRNKDGNVRMASRKELWKFKSNKPLKHQM
jgi:hypothetical protein